MAWSSSTGHDVVVAGDRPIGAVAALGAVVDGGLAPQTRKQRPPGVLLVDGRVADVDRVEWVCARSSRSARAAVVTTSSRIRASSGILGSALILSNARD